MVVPGYFFTTNYIFIHIDCWVILHFSHVGWIFFEFEQSPFLFTVHLKVVEKNKADAARFSPFWNEIIRNLREEDYITNLLVMGPYIIFIPLFASASYLILECCLKLIYP